jgi:hypothetical protein
VQAPVAVTTTLVPPEVLAANPVAAPRTVLIVGDSGMVDLAPALEAGLRAAGVEEVVNSAWPGFGLSSPYFDWRTEWRATVERVDPDLTIVMLGGWDSDFIDARGTRAYAQLVNEALEVLLARGGRVEWLAMLPGGRNYFSVVNTVFIQTQGWSHDVDFFDAQEALRSPDGLFRRTVPRPAGDLLVRKPDHWHFCPDGAWLVTAAVQERLLALGWLPPATPGWENGDWRGRADIYDNPPGACDPRPSA